MLIDLLLSDRRAYTYEAWAAAHVQRELQRKGIENRTLYLSDGYFRDYLFEIEHDRPAWTLSFSVLTPQKTPLCDILDIPHFFWLQSSFSNNLPFHSKRGKIGLNDPVAYSHFSTSYPNVYFLPPGIEFATTPISDQRHYELILFGDVIDLSALTSMWRAHFSEGETKKMALAAELMNPLLTVEGYSDVIHYLKAQETQMALSLLGEGFVLDLFGEHVGCNWLKRLPATIKLHPPLPFSECFEILKESQMIVVSTEDPWYFPALAMGCLPVPPDPIQIRELLQNPELRIKQIEEQRQAAFTRSWETQVNKLLTYMDHSK